MPVIKITVLLNQCEEAYVTAAVLRDYAERLSGNADGLVRGLFSQQSFITNYSIGAATFYSSPGAETRG
jgi:hypothetical protein